MLFIDGRQAPMVTSHNWPISGESWQLAEDAIQ